MAEFDLAERPEKGSFGLSTACRSDSQDMSLGRGTSTLDSRVPLKLRYLKVWSLAPPALDPPAEMLLDCIWANPHDTERGIEQIVPPLGAAGHPVGGHEQALEEDEEVAIVGLFRGGSHLQRVTHLHHSEEGMIGSLVVVSEHPVDVVGAEAGEPKRPALGPEHLLGQSISGLDRAEGIGFPTNAILES